MKPQRVSLGDLLTLVRRKVDVVTENQYAEIGVYSYGRGLFHKQPRSGLEVGDKELFLVQEGDFILQVTFAWEGAVAVAKAKDHALYGSVRMLTFKVDESRCLADYLQLYFRTREGVEQLVRISPGSAGRNRVLNKSRLSEVSVPLPPLDEQRRIVAKIERVAGKVEEARELRRQTTETTNKAVWAVARRLISQLPQTATPLMDWLDLGREAIKTGPFGAQLGSGDFLESGHPIITIGNVQYSGLVLDNLRYVSPEKASSLQAYQVSKGDILFSRMGTVGRCCVVPSMAEGWLYNYHLIRVAPDQARIEPQYLHWLIQASPDIEGYLDDKIRGGTREGVNSRIVAGLPCRVPSLQEQRKIVTYLDNLQVKMGRLKTLQSQTAAELDALLPAVLDRAFRGAL